MPAAIAPARLMAYIGSTYAVPSVAFITTNCLPAALTIGQLIVACQRLTSSPSSGPTVATAARLLGQLGLLTAIPAQLAAGAAVWVGTGALDAAQAWPGAIEAARLKMRIPDRIPANRADASRTL